MYTNLNKVQFTGTLQGSHELVVLKTESKDEIQEFG